VRAWLQAHEQVRAPSTLTRGAEGRDLGVGLARALVPSLSDDLSVPDHDGPDERVGRNQAPSPLGKLERPAHVDVVHDIPSRGGAHERRGSLETAAETPSPPIRTFTVGPGISPGQPLDGFQGVADFHRRWGVSPRPEDDLFGSPQV
jgi:hypothetical protein